MSARDASVQVKKHSVVVVLAAVVLGGALVSRAAADARPVGVAQVVAMLRGIPQQGTTLGKATAPVTLVEFADLQCPYCAVWERQALPTIVRDYVRTGKVKLVYNGMAFLGRDSETALRTALAAGSQQRAWHVLALLFANQGQENAGWVTEGLLQSIGRAVPGLDWRKMLAARRSSGVERSLGAADVLARRLGVNATPSFAVGRRGGPLSLVRIGSLDAAGIEPALRAALRR